MSDASLAKSQLRLGTSVQIMSSASAFRTISKDNTSGNDYKRSTSMAILGHKHWGGRRPCQGSIHSSENRSQITFHVRNATPASSPPAAKKSRQNSPWTDAEELRLKQMRDASNSWAEIAKTFPSRTEESIKTHWYNNMLHTDSAGDEVSTAAASAAVQHSLSQQFEDVYGTQSASHAQVLLNHMSETRANNESKVPTAMKPSATPSQRIKIYRPGAAHTSFKDYGEMTKSEKMAATRWASGSMSNAVAKRRQTLAKRKASQSSLQPSIRNEDSIDETSAMSLPHQAQANSPQAMQSYLPQTPSLTTLDQQSWHAHVRGRTVLSKDSVHEGTSVQWRAPLRPKTILTNFNTRIRKTFIH
ncbi:hypothetical protein E8E14_003343 [Neopestalotiopsis sp. 37M]|nr:hypothetical protein E8E14_003343 [Neopestalotiopsis sp. 37M]